MKNDLLSPSQIDALNRLKAVFQSHNGVIKTQEMINEIEARVAQHKAEVLAEKHKEEAMMAEGEALIQNLLKHFEGLFKHFGIVATISNRNERVFLRIKADIIVEVKFNWVEMKPVHYWAADQEIEFGDIAGIGKIITEFIIRNSY